MLKSVRCPTKVFPLHKLRAEAKTVKRQREQELLENCTTWRMHCNPNWMKMWKQQRMVNTKWGKMNENSSTSCPETLCLLGKSIAFYEHRTDSKHSSISSKTNDVNPIRHTQRIKQLFLPVCSHAVARQIPRPKRNAKSKKLAKTYVRTRRSLPALHRSRKRSKLAKLVATASLMGRKGAGQRWIALCQREILQIPSLTFPRYMTFQIRSTATVCDVRHDFSAQPHCWHSVVSHAWRQINFQPSLLFLQATTPLHTGDCII